MKKILKFCLPLILLGGVVSTSFAIKGGETKVACAADVDVGLVGDFINPNTGNAQGWNTEELVPFTFSVENDRFELIIELKAGNNFKAFSPVLEASQQWIGACEGTLNESYFGLGSGDNWLVKEDGTYLLGFHKDFKTYGEKQYAWQGGDKVTIEKVDVNIYNGDELLRTDSVAMNGLYNPGFVHVEDHYFDGLYLDKELTSKATIPLKVTETIDLYGKFTPVAETVEDYHFIIDAGSFTHVHYWGDNATSWPGATLNTIEGTNLKYIVVPAEFRLTGVLFHDNAGNQTNDVTVSSTHQINVVTLTGETYGVDEVTSGKLDAFVSTFRQARKDGGLDGICNLQSTDPVVTSYLALSENEQNMLKAVVDHDEYSINYTMTYVLSRLETFNNTNLISNVEDYSTLIIVVSILSISAILLVFVISKKRKTA